MAHMTWETVSQASAFLSRSSEQRCCRKRGTLSRLPGRRPQTDVELVDHCLDKRNLASVLSSLIDPKPTNTAINAFAAKGSEQGFYRVASGCRGDKKEVNK